ncbi:glutamate racemase [Leptobacterium flavescens]|uniref:Glutamate racemase n=1 Tax=Leptobacterium flavescens TaxID=472055 RepID=A0A6P0UHT5_9FLAO|nr:glutamate racemase [Leptobacterium flavescens]NER12567.1 glutamate racemase [Leptobacterium flavescens]
MSEQAIGIFDSGVGGTSIWKEINKLLPNESTIYLADSKNAPYGEKTQQEVIDLSVKNTDFLLDRGCKIIVVACNTATTISIDFLRKKYDIPFIGIEPAIKPAALQTKTKAVGVLATRGTLSSSLFHHTTNLYNDGIHVVEQVGEGLVNLIEEGKIHSDEMRSLLKRYLDPMLEENIDHLVLGCTHYPYLIPAIKEMVPASVKIIDSGEAVARQTRAILEKFKLLNVSKQKTSHYFYSNLDKDLLESFIQDDSDRFYAEYKDF